MSGQDIIDSNKNDIPGFFTSVTIGGIELFEATFGKYIVQSFSAQASWSVFGVESKGGGFSSGIGITLSYHFPKVLIFRKVSIGYIYLYKNGYKGNGYKLTIGNCTNTNKGFGFIYEFGIGYSNVKAKYSVPQYEIKELLGPIIKIGLNFNF